MDHDRYQQWLKVPADELTERSAVPFTLMETREDLYRRFADDVFTELNQAALLGEEISIILPLGPTGQYPLLARRINEEGLDLCHVTMFGMDEWLDWESRPVPRAHPFNLEGAFHRTFLDRVDSRLRPKPSNVIFPSPFHLERFAEEVAQRGQPAATFGGVGFQGHVAFNEPPASRWTSVTVDQLRRSRTRIVPLSVDTLIAHAQRRTGGNVLAVPPMAVTLGISELLAARRVRLYLDTGAWKQTILRILLFSPPDVDYPATLMTTHPDVHVVADRETASCPPSG